MANHESRLQGWADPPSVPGWQERALAAVKARQKKSKRSTERRDGILNTFDPELKPYIDEAAKRRGMSMASYSRRALAAFVAYDLGVPIQEILKHMSLPVPYRTYGGGRPLKRLDDDGSGFGDWGIIELGPVPEYNSDYADEDEAQGI